MTYLQTIPFFYQMTMHLSIHQMNALLCHMWSRELVSFRRIISHRCSSSCGTLLQRLGQQHFPREPYDGEIDLMIYHLPF